MAAVPRRRKPVIGHRRAVEEEGEDDGPEQLDLDEDSLTEGSIASDEDDPAGNSDTSNIDEASPTSAKQRKLAGNGAAKPGHRKQPNTSNGPPAAGPAFPPAGPDTDTMLNGLPADDPAVPVDEVNFEALESPTKAAPPVIVSSSSASQPPKRETGFDRQRREHEAYRQRRDEDPSFVPNRGAFFMHDHRGPGPSANGFRPFPRSTRGGRGRGLFQSHFAPMQYVPAGPSLRLHDASANPAGSHLHNPSDPTTSRQWSHDMHDSVSGPLPPRQSIRHVAHEEGPPNGDGVIPTRPSNPEPINRTMSSERALGTVTIRTFIPPMKAPVICGQIKMVQYTKLPDHRPPLRRDKPVRISLPDRPPRYIFPAIDRSFIFIPRAQRPNQQRPRGGRRSGLGSVSGFSRRTSIVGGSYYNGSMYSPSVAMSRRSSIAPDMGVISPTGSTMSRPPMPPEAPRPVVRLPPAARPEAVVPQPPVPPLAHPSAAAESSISALPQPQTHPLPQKPVFQENRPNPIPMHQPRPQKAVSVETIESPTMALPFHQQMAQVAGGFPQDTHTRNPSYPSHTTGTPLSQIPERAIHAAPFQPNAYPQQGYYGPNPYQMIPPPQHPHPHPHPHPQQQPGYYYPQGYGGGMGPPATPAGGFAPPAQQQQPPPSGFGQPGQGDPAGSHPPGGQGGQGGNLVAQEVNGMVYYYDASQIPAVTGYPSYPGPQNYVPSVVNMGGVATPNPEGFFYPQTAPGVVYYPQ